MRAPRDGSSRSWDREKDPWLRMMRAEGREKGRQGVVIITFNDRVRADQPDGKILDHKPNIFGVRPFHPSTNPAISSLFFFFFLFFLGYLRPLETCHVIFVLGKVSHTIL